MRSILFLLCLLSFTTLASQPLVIHEWGTFTALQDENGIALGRINTDDEPVPPFVHTLSRFVLEGGHSFAVLPQNSPLTKRRLTEQEMSMLRYSNKGFPSRHPLVTLRLETPVLYFYPPAGDQKPFNVDVKASFNGGWLTEFYPRAEATAPGLELRSGWWSDEIPIKRDTVGSLTWKKLTVNASGLFPRTDWHVWTAPRETAAAPVVSASGESEKYLFYRGVGNRGAPLIVREDSIGGMLNVDRAGDGIDWKGQTVPALWLLDVRADGRSAWRQISATKDPNNSERVAEMRADFSDGEYGTDRIDALRAAMHKALVADGLFADEATAMLSTWQRAYFESFGKRLFFVVPKAWTDAVLPLEISVPAQVTRSMIGRIELIGDGQRALLKTLRQTPPSDPRWMLKLPENDTTAKFLTRQSQLGNVPLPAETPADYKLYMQLGRFRNALVLDSQIKDPSPQLAEFIKRYGIDTPLSVFDQILHERPAADALLQARALLEKDLVAGFKALHEVVAQHRHTAAAPSAERDIAALLNDPAQRKIVEPVRPECLLMLLERTRDQQRSKALFSRYPDSKEAAAARELLKRWEKERVEAEEEAKRQRAASKN